METPILKDPSAVLDYGFDWTAKGWLVTGETISSHTVTVGAGLTKDSDSESSGVVTIWLSGGTAGEQYLLSCEIITSLGRTDTRSRNILVEDR